MSFARVFILGAAFVLSPTWIWAQPALEPLEKALLRRAPALIKHVQDKGYRNVGVLKFLVAREGSSKFTDNVGTLNSLLARRLEIALVLANDAKAPVGIIENASAVAKKIAGASHLTKEGRQKLFEGTYRLAWGNNEVSADAFLTGTAEISKDLKSLTISLMIADRETNTLVPIGADFRAANQADRLAEISESFIVRGNFTASKESPTSAANVDQQKALTAALGVRDKLVVHPASQASAPIQLTVYYDNLKVPYEFKDGKAFVPEPREGQKVALHIRRDNSSDRYGIVLKVNGENTRDRETAPDLHCRKWVLDPGEGPYMIEGYQTGTDQKELFKVLSATESRDREIYYGPDVGTITMTVFKEGTGIEPASDFQGDDALQQAVVAKVATLSERPKNYYALKASLLQDANRGLIVEGERVASAIQLVSFRPDPRPVMVLTVVYYKR